MKGHSLNLNFIIYLHIMFAKPSKVVFCILPMVILSIFRCLKCSSNDFWTAPIEPITSGTIAGFHINLTISIFKILIFTNFFMFLLFNLIFSMFLLSYSTTRYCCIDGGHFMMDSGTQNQVDPLELHIPLAPW